MSLSQAEPAADCKLCPRLVEFRDNNRATQPNWFNGAVSSFGKANEARFLIVGLAPGLQGANKTGRPFTGDYAGDLLYATLQEFGFAEGTYEAHAEDGLRLVDCMITNAVRCVPPANKPTAGEINMCRQFLTARIESLSALQVILALGRVAHESTLRALSQRVAAFPFAHGARHTIRDGLVLVDSFHCSRYNTNTGKLTTDMFRDVFRTVAAELHKR